MTTSNSLVRLSKLMSVALRHDPAAFGLRLDAQGWVPVQQLLQAIRSRRQWKDITEADFHAVLAASEKQRFEIHNGQIRALYGHSTPKKIHKPAGSPPAVLYHGTAKSNLAAILSQGLRPMSRQYVHLSEDVETATRVGRRKGETVVLLQIDTQADPTVNFYFGNDQTWLADEVPPQLLTVVS